MSLVLAPQFLEDLRYFTEREPRMAKKILELVEDIRRHPFEGLGKPEPLKHLGGNVWSRRITQEHRLVYRVAADTVELIQCRFHY